MPGRDTKIQQVTSLPSDYYEAKNPTHHQYAHVQYSVTVT